MTRRLFDCLGPTRPLIPSLLPTTLAAKFVAARARSQPLPAEVRMVGWPNRYAPAAAAVGLLAAAAGWSWLARRSLRPSTPTRLAAAMWLVPGLLMA